MQKIHVCLCQVFSAFVFFVFNEFLERLDELY